MRLNIVPNGKSGIYNENRALNVNHSDSVKVYSNKVIGSIAKFFGQAVKVGTGSNVIYVSKNSVLKWLKNHPNNWDENNFRGIQAKSAKSVKAELNKDLASVSAKEIIEKRKNINLEVLEKGFNKVLGEKIENKSFKFLKDELQKKAKQFHEEVKFNIQTLFDQLNISCFYIGEKSQINLLQDAFFFDIKECESIEKEANSAQTYEEMKKLDARIDNKREKLNASIKAVTEKHNEFVTDFAQGILLPDAPEKELLEIFQENMKEESAKGA